MSEDINKTIDENSLSNNKSETKSMKKKDEKQMSRKEKIVSEAKSIILIVLVVFSFRSVFFEPFKIPTGSMIPTLLIGDFILVDKMAYGFKVPFSDMFTDPVYISKAKDPKRGDVVVFKYPKDTSINYIKRVVGLPGDTVEVIDKVVYVNDKPIEGIEVDGKPYMDDMDDKFKNYNFKFYKAQVGDNKYIYQVNEDNFMFTDHQKLTVPKGHFFVMGDNRDFSADSRFWGFVPHQNIKGKAIYVWFSMIFPWNDDPAKVRPWRIGTPIR